MDIDKVRDLLSRMPNERSEYEFRNFFLDQNNSFARQLRAVLAEKERIHYEMIKLQAQGDLLNLETADEATNNRFTEIVARRNSAEVNQLSRKLVGLQQMQAQLDDWLADHDEDQLAEVADRFEEQESEHWTEHLGRHAAVEVLALNHSTKDTMMQLSQLPFSDFKKSIIITAQLATFLKQTTEQAEATLQPSTDNLPSAHAMDTRTQTNRA